MVYIGWVMASYIAYMSLDSAIGRMENEPYIGNKYWL